MRVRVVAFATASEIIGRTPLELDLPEAARLTDLKRGLEERFPNLAVLWERLAVAVDGDLVRGDRLLHDGCEVALLPPVSGGGDLPRRRTSLVETAIDVSAVERQVAAAHCGAVLLFLGTVRDHHGGRTVERLTYSAYRPMAETTLERIAAELEDEATGDLRVSIVHRLGDVPVGEPSVVIAAASPHRAAAYEASRQALERLKREVPIWKREHYQGGDAVWREEEPLEAPPPVA